MPPSQTGSRQQHPAIGHWRRLRALPRRVLLQLLLGLSLAGGSLYGFAKLVSEILEAETVRTDQAVLAWLHAWDPDWMPGLMYFITKSGSGPMVIALSLLVLAWLWFKHRNLHAILMFAIASLGGVGLNLLLKLGFQRPRPLLDDGIDATGWSLPSGHAMSAMIFYGFISYLLIRSQRRLWAKLLLGVPLVGFILLIGLSRIYLQAHYFSDVVAGYAAGCAWLMTCILSLEFRPWYRKYWQATGELPGDNSLPDDALAADSDDAKHADATAPDLPVSADRPYRR